MNNTGERIRNFRNSLGLTQAEFCVFAEVGVRAQSQYETNERSPKTDYLINISEKLNADIQYIVTGVPSKKLEPEANELIALLRGVNKDVRKMAVASALGVIRVWNDSDFQELIKKPITQADEATVMKILFSKR